MSRFSALLLLFLVVCSACNKASEQQVAAPKPTANKADMAQVRRAFRDNYAATDNLEEKRRLANELIDQYAPELKPSFANFTGEGWDGALQAEDFQKMLSNCVTNNPQRQGYIFEVQAARDIAASGLQELVCNESVSLGGKKVNLDILATDRSTGKKYNFETKDWKKTSFTEEKVPDLIDQLERQKAALPDAVHVFFFNKADREIPSNVRRQIEDVGFTIIARNNSPKRATALLKQLRAGN